MFDLFTCRPLTGMLWVFLVVLLVVLFLQRARKELRDLRKQPPGPWGVPIFGYLFKIRTEILQKLTDLHQKYGKVYQISLGFKKVVVVSDPDLIRQAFRQPVFSGRPDTGLTGLIGGYGIINSGGALWQEQRTFLHSALRDFGAKNHGPNRVSLENNIQTQVSDFLNHLKATEGAPFFIRPELARAVSNVIGSVLMGVTFEEQDPGFTRLLALIEEGFKLLTMAVPVNFIPVLRYLPGVRYNYKKIETNKIETAKYFAQVAKQHKLTLQEGTVRDFVDAFFFEQMKAKNYNKKTYFSDEQLHQVMGDVFSAGLETVTSTLEWLTLFLVRHPEVQNRVFQEIVEVVGVHRKPSLEDLPNMPYSEATIWEVLRRANVIALGNSHAALEDAYLGDFFIPKGTHVIPNLWAIHMSPELWESPQEFKPERFLVDGRISKPSYFMPFSVGRRMCVGDALTKMEVFLFMTRLLQEFELRVPEGEDPPTLESETHVSNTVKPFKLCAVPRVHAY